MSEEIYHMILMNEDLEVTIDTLTKKELAWRLKSMAEENDAVPAIVDPEYYERIEMNDLLESNSRAVLIIKGGKVVAPSIDSKISYEIEVE